VGLGFGFPGDCAWPLSTRSVCRRCGAHLRHRRQPVAAIDPVLHFMGAILERCGLAETCLHMGQLFGRCRRVAYSSFGSGPLLGAITGTVAASVIAMGLISLPGDVALRLRSRCRPASSRRQAPSPRSSRPRWCWCAGRRHGQVGGDMYAGASSELHPGRVFCGWIFIVSILAEKGCRRCPNGSPHASVSVLFVRCMSRCAVAGADLHGARHPGRLATPYRGRRDGAVGALALATCTAADLGPAQQAWTPRSSSPPCDVHPGRLDRVQPDLRGVDGDL